MLTLFSLSHRLHDGVEIDIVRSKYCQTIQDGLVQLIIRNPKACDAGVYSLRLAEGPTFVDSSVRVDVQSKGPLSSLLASCFRGPGRRGSTGEPASQATLLSQWREHLLLMGGAATLVALCYTVKALLLTSPVSGSDALSQAFAANVKEWVYQCGSAISSCASSDSSR